MNAATAIACALKGRRQDNDRYDAQAFYNEWLAEADRQSKLGWSIAASRVAGGKVCLKVADNGAAGQGFVISARAIHPLGRAPEQALRFEPQGDGNWLSAEALPAGRWTLHFEMRRDADHYRTIADVK